MTVSYWSNGVSTLILAGTPEHGACSECGRPYERQVEQQKATGTPYQWGITPQNIDRNDGNRGYDFYTTSQTLGWSPACKCGADAVPATVLDPFAGSGTTLAVAQKLGRHSIGLDLNPKYLELAQKRLEPISLPML